MYSLSHSGIFTASTSIAGSKLLKQYVGLGFNIFQNPCLLGKYSHVNWDYINIFWLTFNTVIRINIDFYQFIQIENNYY